MARLGRLRKSLGPGYIGHGARKDAEHRDINNLQRGRMAQFADGQREKDAEHHRSAKNTEGGRLKRGIGFGELTLEQVVPTEQNRCEQQPDHARIYTENPVHKGQDQDPGEFHGNSTPLDYCQPLFVDDPGKQGGHDRDDGDDHAAGGSGHGPGPLVKGDHIQKKAKSARPEEQLQIVHPYWLHTTGKHEKQQGAGSDEIP